MLHSATSSVGLQKCKLHHKNDLSTNLFNIVQFNVRSLLPKIEEVRNVFLNMYVHVICINETWLDSSVSDNEINIDGFTVFRKDRTRHGGGVAVFVRRELLPILKSDLDIPGLEAIWIEVNVKSEQFLICSLYRPPSACSGYFERIIDNIEHASIFCKNIIITGDLNINYNHDVGSNSCSVKLLENMFDLKQLIHSPTRLTPTSSTIIDHILTSIPEKHVSAGVVQFCFSDHYVVYTALSLTPPNAAHRYLTKRCFKKFIPYNFFTDISRSVVLNGSAYINDVETAWQNWKYEFVNICNKHAPMRKFRIKNKNNPWFNDHIQNMIYERNHYHNLAIKTNKSEHWMHYRSLRNKINETIKYSKKHYFRTFISLNNNNISGMWRALRHVLPAKKEQDSIPNELDCNKFNDYFATIGNNLTCNLDTNKPLPSINVPKPTHPFIFKDIDFHYIRSKIIDLPDKAYPDSVGIDNIMLKLAADVIAISLTNILNLSLQTSELPNEWKTARITPIYKKNGSKFECNNYRPISILPTIAQNFGISCEGTDSISFH